MKIICDCIDCYHCRSSHECDLNTIHVGRNSDCLEFTPFDDSPEYHTLYWIAVKTPIKGINGRVFRYGKEIINDRVFYTRSDTRLSDDEIYLDDSVTGYSCGSIEWVKKHWDMFISKVLGLPNVMDLPICEYDKNIKCHVIVGNR